MFPFLKNMISVFILEFNDRGALWRTQNARNMADPKVRSGSVFTLRSLSDLPLMSYPKRTESVRETATWICRHWRPCMEQPTMKIYGGIQTVCAAADNEDHTTSRHVSVIFFHIKTNLPMFLITVQHEKYQNIIKNDLYGIRFLLLYEPTKGDSPLWHSQLGCISFLNLHLSWKVIGDVKRYQLDAYTSNGGS